MRFPNIPFELNILLGIYDFDILIVFVRFDIHNPIKI
jgi:hypothetical protein